MPQLTTLYKSGKNKAEVIALGPRVIDRSANQDKPLRTLHLSDLLSRHLDVEQIVEVFVHEIQAEFPHCGYGYECDDVGLDISSGDTDKHRVNYRLSVQSQELGEITIYRDKGFGSEDLLHLERLLCALVYPLKNAIMYQIALRSAYGDPLTGLNNRAAMEKQLSREIELSNRHSQPMALLVMDLDGFKQINDRCGHDVGDQVLRDVSQVLKGAVRNTDLLYRFGGDEFVSGLAQTDINGAIEVSERIRCGVESLLVVSTKISSSIEISIGVTMIRANDNFADVFKRADSGLYQAKQGGKNRIIII